MEITEIKQLWKHYDEKIERNLSLNMKLIKEMKLEKAKSSLNRYTFLKSMSILFQMFVVHYLINCTITNFDNRVIAVQSIILAILTIVALIWNMYQMQLIMTIDYSDPIVKIQKRSEKLKIQKLRYNKFIFCASYPYIFLMSFTVLQLSPLYFQFDWALLNVTLAVLWFPFAYWLIKKFNHKNLTSPIWRRLAGDSTLTPGSVSRPLNNTLDFLNEIRQFENAGESSS
jgi:hypothetical protein